MEKLQGSKGAQFSSAACLSQKVFFLSNPICAEWQQVKWEEEKESQCLKNEFLSCLPYYEGGNWALKSTCGSHLFFTWDSPPWSQRRIRECLLYFPCWLIIGGRAMLYCFSANSSSWLFWRSLPFCFSSLFGTRNAIQGRVVVSIALPLLFPKFHILSCRLASIFMCKVVRTPSCWIGWFGVSSFLWYGDCSD